MAPTTAPWAGDGEDMMEELHDEDEAMDGLGELGVAGPNRQVCFLNKNSPFQALEVDPPLRDIVFRAYYTPSTSSGNINQHTGKTQRGSVLVCHHGAGSAGTTFACLARSVHELSGGELGVLAFDARGHGKSYGRSCRCNGLTSGVFLSWVICNEGKTRTQPEEAEQVLSFENLQHDFVALVKQVFPNSADAPDVILLGHSMGASPVMSAAPLLQHEGYKIVGVVVLDVVEGTAVEALPLMRNILSQRPTKFGSVEEAIQWHISSGAVRNLESAKISVPSLLVPLPNRAEGAQDVVWRTDLMATAPYWEEWYKNLSSEFLAARAAKLLVLAGQERLDRELMVGQMQGKFQLEVLPDVGHYLHEKHYNIDLAAKNWK
ncbi:hypothetical protein QFC22_004788 [Naganishia vaughanmartiniae]|uniref:Uncharacterized protein n=1 Tax=Naganishia vaughanmartiniae TaxID=1424756 RepID=A0ACC2WXG3_9TREE|nr:hypothetical protein QFC22_004788 [Naganishia vaughanmartiniae]